MALKGQHREWRLAAISPIDVKAVDLDAVLTRLWLRIAHGNRPLISRPGTATTVSELAMELERRANDRFVGFSENPGTAEAWLRADLVNTLRRTPDQFTVARPVHALATRIRSSDRQTQDSNDSLAVYSWLAKADKKLLSDIRDFIEVDVEADGDGSIEEIDLATYALAVLGSQREPDKAKSEKPDALPAPLCNGQARHYADDLRRLLAYRGAMPRAALVDHIRRLTGLHLGLYLLRVFRITVEAERRSTAPKCSSCADGRIPRHRLCPHDLELVVDCGEDARSAVAKLAEASWDEQEDLLAQYVRSHLALKKLDEFASYVERSRPAQKLPHATVHEIASVERNAGAELIDVYFDRRIDEVIEQAGGDDEEERVAHLAHEYREMGLSSFRAYVALLAHFSERRWVSYHRYLLDSLFSKNSTEGMLRQPLGGARKRRAAMGASLLETLTLVAVVAGGPGEYYTRPLQVDELIARLESRYGLRIATPPTAMTDDIEVPRLLAVNVDRFKARLRETGLFTDLSDAFLAQRVRPRHTIETS
jgi:hypothetical protein